MKTCPDCKQTLLLTEFSNNKRQKDGLCVYCRVCSAARSKAYKNKNQDAYKESRKAWVLRNRETLNIYALFKYHENKDAHQAKTREYYRNNQEELISYQKKYRSKNKERLIEYRQERYPQIKARQRNYNVIRQRNLKQRSFPNEKNAMIDFYRNCPKGHHVDHIVPIANSLVCGLHVLANLQYLPAIDNLKKNNKFEVM